MICNVHMKVPMYMRVSGAEWLRMVLKPDCLNLTVSSIIHWICESRQIT